eukprot:1961961-Rhodomonas_salina.1
MTVLCMHWTAIAHGSAVSVIACGSAVSVRTEIASGGAAVRARTRTHLHTRIPITTRSGGHNRATTSGCPSKMRTIGCTSARPPSGPCAVAAG